MAQAANEQSLSTIAQYGRKTILYGVLLLLAFMVGRTLLRVAVQTYKELNPPAPAAPTMGFGKLPQIIFPNQTAQEKPSEIILETVGGQLPGAGPTLPVFFMPAAQPDLLAFDRAKEKAASLGFVFPPEQISTHVYRWRRTLPIPSTLEMNIITGISEIKTDWASSLTLLDEKKIPEPSQLTLEARTLLRSANMLPDDIATSEGEITYIMALAGETRPVSSINEADFVELDLYRVTPVGLPTITAYPDQGVVEVLFSGSREQGQRVLSLEYDYYPVSWQTFETYPIWTSRQAFQALQAGEGFVIAGPKGKPATVRQAYLAYFEPIQEVNYFQPVWVFTGDDGFTAVVPALNPEVFAQ